MTAKSSIIEVGFSLTRAVQRECRLAGDLVLSLRRTPSRRHDGDHRARGDHAESHCSFGMIGMWIEANGYEIAGPCREVFLEPVSEPLALEKALVEIQFPSALSRVKSLRRPSSFIPNACASGQRHPFAPIPDHAANARSKS